MGYGKHRRSKGGNSNPGQTSRTENPGRYNFFIFSFRIEVTTLWSTDYGFVDLCREDESLPHDQGTERFNFIFFLTR